MASTPRAIPRLIATTTRRPSPQQQWIPQPPHHSLTTLLPSRAFSSYPRRVPSSPFTSLLRTSRSASSPSSLSLSTSRPLPSAFAPALARIRAASTDASKGVTEVKKRETATETVVEEVAKEVEDAEKEGKKKIEMGEIRRLAELAKPERKTIGIALGLVRFFFFFLCERFPSPCCPVELTRSSLMISVTHSSASPRPSPSPSPSASAASSISSPATVPDFLSPSLPPPPSSLSSLPSAPPQTWEGQS
jgi:hypothetical protein